MITITKIDFRNYHFFSEIPRENKIIKEALSVWVDGAQFSEKFKRGWWDGKLRFFNKKGEFASGLIDEVIFHLKDSKVDYEIIDNDYRIKKIEDVEENEILRPHQQEAVKAFFKTNIGIIKVPTRGGKTFISGEIIRQIIENYKNANFLFYVDTMDLFDQTVTELSKYLNVQERSIGTINSLGVNIKQVTVAMIQTVTSIYSRRKDLAKQLDEYFLNLNCLIVDEIQEYMSDNRIGLLSKCKNADFVLGLSATPFKQGNMIGNLTLKGFFGGVCYDVSIERLQKEGYLALDKVILISYEHTEKIKSTGDGIKKYHEYLNKMIFENKDRNLILLTLIKICNLHKWKTLVLFNSKKHGRIISELSGCNFICGDDNTFVRNSNKENFLRGRGKVLLASNIYKKGITLPEVEILIIADGGLEASNLMQKKGRVLGAVENKTKAITIDIMDVEKVYFSAHSSNRLDAYVETVGNDRIEVYDDFDLKSVEESIRDWFDEK